MNKKKLSYIIATATIAVALILYAAYILIGIYSDVLVTAQDRNVFAGDSMFFDEHLSRPFGIFQYVGAYLTQFFYYPALGAAMLIAIWTASAFIGIRAFGLKGVWRATMIVSAACLMASVVDLGYWIYILTIPGYWFSQSLAFLILMLLLWAAHSTPRRFRIAWYVLIGFVLFPFFGWFSYVFSLCLAISQFSRDDKSHPSWIDAIGVALSFVAPLVFRMFMYTKLQNEDIFAAGFPFFHTASDSQMHLSTPFFILLGVTLFAAFGRLLPSLKKVPACAAYLIVGIASCYAVWSTMFKDANYIYEMQMTQATMAKDWKRVIAVAEMTGTPSRTMVMLKNIALLNTGELSSRSFELSNDGMEINNPDHLNLNLMHIAAPLIYFNHGAINYAMRWAMEFAVPLGFSPYYLKVLASCAEVSGEKYLGRRYMEHLHGMTFYTDWTPAPVNPIVKELYAVNTDALSSDDNNCERFIISHYSKTQHANSPHYSELRLLYAMIIRNPSHFWSALYDYVSAHKGKPLPTQFEEAYCLFMDQAQVNFPLPVQISPTTVERYKEFLDDGARYAQYSTESETREAMRPNWAGTYWWFNAFGRNSY